MSAQDRGTLPQTEKKENRNPFFDSSFFIFGIIALVAGGICYLKGKEVFCSGLDASLSMFVETAPRFTAAFVLAGFIQVLIPREFIRKWVGEKSGLRGILIASLAGALTPGGPMTSFPLVAALYTMGADVGSLTAYLTAWELLGIQRILIWELPFLGVKFVVIRLAVSLFLPLIAGYTARQLVIRIGSLRPVRKE